jgi:hypothetical protein
MVAEIVLIGLVSGIAGMILGCELSTSIHRKEIHNGVVVIDGEAFKTTQLTMSPENAEAYLALSNEKEKEKPKEEEKKIGFAQ